MDVELVIDNAIAASRRRSRMFVEQYRCPYANSILNLSTTAVTEGFRCDASVPVVTGSSPNRVVFFSKWNDKFSSSCKV